MKDEQKKKDKSPAIVKILKLYYSGRKTTILFFMVNNYNSHDCQFNKKNIFV
jgi:hypothetical protein